MMSMPSPTSTRTGPRATLRRAALAMALVVGAGLAAPAWARHPWLMPSTTVLTPSDGLITVDAAVSDQLFQFDAFALKLDTLAIFAPDNSPLAPQNPVSTKQRSSFELPIATVGTYKMAVVNDSLFANWKEDGKPRRWRGTAEAFAKEVPANAEGLAVTQMLQRVEAFVTNGKPSREVFKTTGRGIELVPVTHPNDLVAGEPATFQLLLDGAPAVGMKVSLTAGGTRYRTDPHEVVVTADRDGRVSFRPVAAGPYLLEAGTTDAHASFDKATSRRTRSIS